MTRDNIVSFPRRRNRAGPPPPPPPQLAALRARSEVIRAAIRLYNLGADLRALALAAAAKPHAVSADDEQALLRMGRLLREATHQRVMLRQALRKDGAT